MHFQLGHQAHQKPKEDPWIFLQHLLQLLPAATVLIDVYKLLPEPCKAVQGTSFPSP